MGAFATGYAPAFDVDASPANARAVIVKALKKVPELLVSETSPTTPAPFCAWPKWALSAYLDAGRLANTVAHEFDVLVLLPNGFEPDTTANADDLLPRVIEALWPVGVITLAQPAQVLFDNQQNMPALQIRIIPHNC